MKLSIRPAQTTDLKQIQNMLNNLHNERTKLWEHATKKFHTQIKSRPKLRINDLKKNIFIIAEQDSEIIGFVVGNISSRKNYIYTKLGYIDILYIQQIFRKSGIATKLIKNLILIFKTKGCDHITTHTDAENMLAQHLYEQIGMKKVTIEYWKNI